MSNLSSLEKEYIKSNWRSKSKEDIALKLKKDLTLIEEYVTLLEEKNRKKDSIKKVKNTKTYKKEKINSIPIFKRYTIEPYNIGKIDIIYGSLAFLFTIVLYTLTLTPSLSAGDNGELTTAAYFLGVGHAPGYPFYTLMSKIFTYLPIKNIAWRTNFFSAFCAASAIVFFYLTLVKVLGQNRIKSGFSPIVQIPAFLASITFAISDNMWAQATMAEVYSLNILQMASIILLLVFWFESVWKHAGDEAPYYGSRYLMAFGFLYGVALANHHITLPFAFAPLLMIGLTLFLIHKNRYINHIETSFISIFVFIILICIGGFGYYKFIMGYDAYLYFPTGIPSNDSIFTILFKPLLEPSIISDILMVFTNSKLLRPDMFHMLANPTYPTLYKGMFLVLWPLLLVVAWFLVYKFILQKSSKFGNDNDYITGISMVYYQMLFMLMLGVMIYAYMPIRARALPPLNWGQLNEPTGWENLSYFFSMLHRKQYGASGNDIRALFILHPEQVMALIGILKTQLTTWGLFLIIPGLWQIFKKNKHIAIFSLFGLLSFSISLMAYTNPPPSARTLFFVEIFFLPAVLYLMIIVGFGCQWYMEYLNKNILSSFKSKDELALSTPLEKFNSKYIISTVALITIIIPIFILNLKRNNNYNDFSNHDYSYNLMNSLPENAIFATEGGDNQVFGLVYYTMVERRRPDLKVYDQKGNVFERIYGNLMKTDGRWIGEISDNVDKDFIEAGRPYYMAWKRNGIEKLGDYYFKSYGLVYRVLPIRYALVDELEFFKYMTVNDYKNLASSKLKTNYSDAKISKDINMLLDEGFISTPRKNLYNGNEDIVFVKALNPVFENLQTDEDYWNSYTVNGTPEEQSQWDFLTREIFVSSYGIAKMEFYNGVINRYNQLITSMGNNNIARNGITKDEALAKIDEYQKLKLREEEKILTIGFDMSNVFFALGSQAIAEKQYEKAVKMFERVVELEKLVYPAYFNLTASYEYLARSSETPYSKEKEYLEKAKETLEMAKATFYRGRDMGDEARNQNPNFQQISQYLNRIDAQMTTSRQQADSIKEQAISENTFDSYNSYGNFVYQTRQNVDAALWAKLEALKRVANKDQRVAITKEISILYANIGNTQMASSTLKNAFTSIAGLNKADIEGIEFDLASMYLNLKQFNEAKSIYIKYTNDISQNGAFAIYALGHIALEEGNTQEALAIYSDFDKMLPLSATNQSVSALKQEIDNRRLQIINYLNQAR